MPKTEDETVATAKFDMRMPFWGILCALFALTGAYYAQREASNVALTKITVTMENVQDSVKRIEIDRYTASDARRDLAWRDERTVEIGKRVTELETARHRR